MSVSDLLPMQEARNNTQNPNLSIIIVGAKADLADKR
jgi:hypothetical protein